MSNEVVACKPLVRPSAIEDVQYLADHIREEDRQEIWHIARKTPLEAFQSGYDVSEPPFTIEWKGVPVAMFGVSGEGTVGCPWMLATDDLKLIKKTLLKECRAYVDDMLKKYPFLTNQVWAENVIHIRWLIWLGFTFVDPEPMGPDNEMFIRFYKEA